MTRVVSGVGSGVGSDVVSGVNSMVGGGYSYDSTGGDLVAVAGRYTTTLLVYIVTTSEGVVAVEHRLELPAHARLDRATFVIGASPAGPSTSTASVATVRESAPLSGTGPACVIDFGRMVTVGGVAPAQFSGVTISSVAVWTGAAWQPVGSTDSFPERTTDRLLVQGSSSGVTFIDGVRGGSVALPAQPQGLELLVDGNTVWFERQGSTPDVAAEFTGPGAPGDTPVVTYAVDRTEPVREAFARARDVDGVRTVAVALRAPVPGTLVLQPSAAMLHEHLVQFGADALSRTVEADEEGLHVVPLAGPQADGTFAAGDEVRAVELELRGSFGRDRVQPVAGPPIEDEVSLVLGAGRVALLGIPRTVAARFGALSGIRLRLHTGPRGAELAGRLLAPDAQGGAGEPVSGGEIAPLQVAAQHDGWATIGFAEAVPPGEPDGDVAAWVELTASYGEIEVALTPAPVDDPVAPGAPARRRLPGGGTVPVAVLADFGPLGAALRLVGVPGTVEPIPAVRVSLAGTTAAAEANPAGDAIAMTLAPDAGLAPADGRAELVLAIAATGSVTVSNVRILYSLGGSP